MNFVDLIEKKKQGFEHNKEEINFIIDSYMSGKVSEAELAAWLTVICFKGMTADETAYFTESLGKSGKCIDFGELSSKIVDKHSTGGVGDKVTITLIPILAAAGVPVAKLADRGLGTAAGTVDKLESIPKFKTNLTIQEIIDQVKNVNAVIASQTDDLAPAEKKIRMIRDKISAVDFDALLVSSLISKKIASGTSNIIIDVKYGSGAFKKTPEEAVLLSKLIIEVGKILNKNIMVLISSMDEPLGRTIGNSLEVIEAIEFLKGNIKSGDLVELTYSLASMTLLQLELCENISEAREMISNIISTGKALKKFKELILAQDGEVDVIDDYDKFMLPCYKVECESKKSGYIQNINALNVSNALKALDAARENSSRPIDLSVGIFLNKKSGEWVNKGEILYTLYSNDLDKTKVAQQ